MRTGGDARATAWDALRGRAAGTSPVDMLLGFYPHSPKRGGGPQAAANPALLNFSSPLP